MKISSVALAALVIMLGMQLSNGVHLSNGLNLKNGMQLSNGVSISNGVRLNNGISLANGMQLTNGLVMDELDASLFDKFLSPAGVGDLTKVPNVTNVDGGACLHGDTCVLDNRHITIDLKEKLCDPTPVDIDKIMESQGVDPTAGGVLRYYLDVLLYLAWPDNAKLHLCCSGSSGPDTCNTPIYTLPEDSKNLAIAPHFLTPLFEERQQEALTSAFIAKINTLGKPLDLDVAGRFDLGPAGIKFITRDKPDQFKYELGQSWGNMFLDCKRTPEHPMCEASMEIERRDFRYHSLPMFTCTGESLYPTKISGKSCFSKDMATNEEDGCGMVAAVGGCDTTCVGGFCGVNEPPLPGRGTTNVLYVYMNELDREEMDKDRSILILAIILPVAAFSLFLALLRRKYSVANRSHKPTDEEGTEVEVNDLQQADV